MALQCSDHSYPNKTRRLVQPTKKVNCPAQMTLRQIVYFPEFKITADTRTCSKRDQTSKSLRKRLEEGSGTVEFDHCIKYEFPSPDNHQNHLGGEGAGIRQPVDERIIWQIHFLVREGVSRCSEMMRHIEIYVKNELFRDDEMPSILDRRFYPTRKDIQSHIYRAKIQCRLSKLDQHNLH
ncbi:calcium-responsive transcription factor-like [Lineus longissimus]|uniref:calcium-responsive transcription factor-like n=1 Tax=Lineus longissimus TaxID=88925 RepID=UPI00315CB71D